MAASFPIGSKVILQNLNKGSKYNGKHGVIKSNPDGTNDGRQQVLLHDDHSIICVKPKNMKLVAKYSSNKDTTKSKKQYVFFILSKRSQSLCQLW